MSYKRWLRKGGVVLLLVGCVSLVGTGSWLGVARGIDALPRPYELAEGIAAEAPVLGEADDAHAAGAAAPLVAEGGVTKTSGTPAAAANVALVPAALAQAEPGAPSPVADPANAPLALPEPGSLSQPTGPALPADAHPSGAPAVPGPMLPAALHDAGTSKPEPAAPADQGAFTTHPAGTPATPELELEPGPGLGPLVASLATPVRQCAVRPPPASGLDYLPGPGSPSSNIGIFISVWGDHMDDGGVYRRNLETWRCYAARHGYRFAVVNSQVFNAGGCDDVPRDSYYFRHCALAKVVRDLLDPTCSAGAAGLSGSEWVFHVDADTLVYNHDRRLEDFLPAGGQSVMLGERWASGEIMAGIYFVHVDLVVVEFLEKWVDMHTTFTWQSNHDNGALMTHVLHTLAPELGLTEAQVEECDELMRNFQEILQLPFYDRHIACVRHALGPRRIFRHLGIWRRGQGFAYDEEDGPPGQKLPFSDRLLVLHGAFASKTAEGFERVFENCTAPPGGCLEPRRCPAGGPWGNRGGTVQEEVDALIRWDKCGRLGLGMHDTAGCMARGNCTADLTPQEWQELEPILAENKHCPTPGKSCRCDDDMESVDPP